MIITTLLAYVVSRRLWKWPLPVSVAVTVLFLIVDVAFFGANMVKVTHGGWFPLLVGAAGFVCFTTWKKGREQVAAELSKSALPIAIFVRDVREHGLLRAPGAAVFLSGSLDTVPVALLHNIKLNRVLHEEDFILTVLTAEVPYVSDDDRLEVESLGAGFHRVVVRYGFMQDPDIPAALRWSNGTA